MLQEINLYTRKYGFFFIWIGLGAINMYLGAFAVIVTFAFLIQKQRIVQLLLALWVLFVFSDNQYSYFLFASLVKPLIMLLTGAAVLFGKVRIDARNRFILAFIPFFVYCAVSSLFSVVLISSYQKLISYFFVYLITSYIVSQIFRENRGREFFKEMVYIGISILTISVLIGLIFPDIGAKYGGRLNGLFRNPNGMGLFTAVFFMLASLFFGMTTTFTRFIKRYTFFIAILCLVMTGSRTSMGAVIIFYMGSVMSSFSPWYFVLSASVLFYFFADIYAGILLLVGKAGLGEQLRVSNLEYASGRIFIWRAAWMEIQNYYLFGGGFDFAEGGYAIWKVKYNAIMPDLKYHVGNIHQSFLTMWLNTGLFGLSLFAYGWIRRIVESLAQSKLTLPISFALVFMASYESWLVASMNPFTIQAIIMFTVILNYDKGKMIKEEKAKLQRSNHKELQLHNI